VSGGAGAGAELAEEGGSAGGAGGGENCDGKPAVAGISDDVRIGRVLGEVNVRADRDMGCGSFYRRDMAALDIDVYGHIFGVPIMSIDGLPVRSGYDRKQGGEQQQCRRPQVCHAESTCGSDMDESFHDSLAQYRLKSKLAGHQTESRGKGGSRWIL
jgi:hypothetical protein